MALHNTPERWGCISQSLHWLIAVLILGMGALGLTLGELPKTPKYFWVYTLHKSVGITVLALMLLRLGWRLHAGAPVAVAGTPRWQHTLAACTHWLLYALVLAIPLSGWLYDSASGLRPFKLFGWLTMPKLAAPDETLQATSHALHEWGFWLLVVLVAMHAGAALHHHVVRRDDTLARMLPEGWLRAPADKENRNAN